MDSAIWTEKYRPKDFSEIKGQKEIVKRIKAFVEMQNIPHLLFTGPAGVGKTTLVYSFIDKPLEKDYLMTVGVDMATKEVTAGGGIIKLSIFDVAGQDRFADFRSVFFNGASSEGYKKFVQVVRNRKHALFQDGVP